MNFYKTLLLSLFTLLLSQTATGQDKIEILPSGKYHYKYQEKLYKKNQLKDIFAQKEKAYKKYKNYKRTQNGAGIFGGISILLAIAFMTEEKRNPQSDDALYSKNEFIYGVTFILSGTISLLAKANAKHKRKQAFKIFNSEKVSPSEIGANSLEINIGFTTAGLGVRFSF